MQKKKYLKVTKLVNGKSGNLLEFILLKIKQENMYKLNNIQLKGCDILVKCSELLIPCHTTSLILPVDIHMLI